MHDYIGFLTDQLTYIMPGVFERQYPELNYGFYAPVDPSPSELAPSVAIRTSDYVGQAEEFNELATNPPIADVVSDEFQTPIIDSWLGFRYSRRELDRHIALGSNLSADKANAARRGHERYHWEVLMNGSSSSARGWESLMRSTSVAAANVAQNAAGNSRLWEDKSAEEIRRDINAALRLVYVESMTIEYANTILLPPDALAILAETITANDRTLLEVIQRSNITTLVTGQPLTFAALLGLEDAGDTDTGRMVAYRRDPDVCTYIQPQDFSTGEIWQINPWTFFVPTESQSAGFHWLRPGSAKYRDGITA